MLNKIALLKINNKPFKINVIRSSKHHSELSDSIIEMFYNEGQVAMKHKRSDEISVIMVDGYGFVMRNDKRKIISILPR